MIGVSLPFGWCSDEKMLQSMLPILKKYNVDSVELRTVRPGCDPETVLQAARRLWQEGFRITIHGSVLTLATAVEDVFAPLRWLLENLEQDSLNITVHPITEDNCAMLLALSDHALENGYPVTIALENNRLLPDKTQGDSTALVLSAVETVNRPNVGICFDMGHHAYYVQKNCPETPELLPPKAFWKRVIHTHIHDIKALRTHFPLGDGELSLQRYLGKLDFEYFGLYNLELDFPRIAENWTPEAALEQSLQVLQENMPCCARLYDEVRTNFDTWFQSALKCWETQADSFALIHSSSYLFHTAGCKWGMDIAFRNAGHLAKSPARAAELLKDMQMLVLSHGHRDHYEEETLKALAGNDTIFVVPDFLEERTLALGIPGEKLVVARPGEPVCLFGVTLEPFVSSHFRPDGRGVPEYGYRVTASGCPSMVFPVDIRDFAKLPQTQPGEYCFANLWLEDNAEEGWRPVLKSWANYMGRLSVKNIFITHLYEDGRPADKMWRGEHSDAAMQEMKQQFPQLTVRVPSRGEVIFL